MYPSVEKYAEKSQKLSTHKNESANPRCGLELSNTNSGLYHLQGRCRT